MKQLSICLLVTLLLPWQAAMAQETRRYFQDWLAACRDDGFCSAIAYDNTDSTAGVDADYLLRVGRQAEGLYWEISFTTVVTMPGPNENFDVTIDDKPITFTQPNDAGAYGSLNEFFFLNQPAQTLFDAMGPGENLRIMFNDEAGLSQTARFSLSGLTAALLWVDEQQNRLGSERVANAAPVGLTPVNSAYPANVPAELLRRHAASPDCEPFEVLPHANDIIQAEIDSGTIYFLPCFAGAYNFSYTVWTQREDYFSQLVFAEYSNALGWSGTDILVNPEYDAKTGVLTAFSKGRGLGDCGSFGLWQWTGSNFRMLEYAHKGECDAQGNLETFPIIYSADPNSAN